MFENMIAVITIRETQTKTSGRSYILPIRLAKFQPLTTAAQVPCLDLECLPKVLVLKAWDPRMWGLVGGN
jgi:hypothetical protein